MRAALATVRRRKDIVSFFARTTLCSFIFCAPPSLPLPLLILLLLCCFLPPLPLAPFNCPLALPRAVLNFFFACAARESWIVHRVWYSKRTKDTPPSLPLFLLLSPECPPLMAAFRVRNAITFSHLRAIIYAFLLMPQSREKIMIFFMQLKVEWKRGGGGGVRVSYLNQIRTC